MAILKRIDQRRLRHIHAPHGPGSNRATVHEASTALREALYKDFDEKTQNKNRTEFAHFLNEQYGIPMQTAYGKLRQWRVEEWEVYGLIGVINKYCNDRDIPKPAWPQASPDDPGAEAALTRVTISLGGATAASSQPSSQPGGAREGRWQHIITAWLNVIPGKMHFYHYLRERGMCRTFLRRIISGASCITTLQLVGLSTAFNQWVQKQLHSHIHL